MRIGSYIDSGCENTRPYFAYPFGTRGIMAIDPMSIGSNRAIRVTDPMLIGY